MHQATKAPSTPVVRPKAAGSVKMPAPTIEPTTSATSAPRDSVASRESFMKGCA